MPLNFPPAPLTVGQEYTFNAITWFWNGSAWELLTATDANFTRLLLGTTADFTRFPNALAAVSSVDVSIQQNESHNIGLIAEGVADPTNSAIYGVGVYGVGYTSAGTRSGGVIGEGHVSATTDSGSAIGVRGYSNDTHASGFNIGLFGEASGSGTGNYALAMQSGNILSVPAQTWTLVDNTASALSIDSTGKTGILVVKTTNGAEGITASGTLEVTGATTLSSTLEVTGATTLNSTLGVTVTTNSNAVTVTYNPTTTSGAAVVTTGKDTQGGTGYFDFLKVTNTTSGATNPNKSFRVNSTGTIEIINSAYGATIFALSDAGRVTVEGVTSTGATGTGRFVFDTTPTISDPAFTGTVSLAPATFESVSTSATAATGTVNVDVKTNTVFYYTANATANWTFNFRGNGATTLNDYLPIGKSISIAFLVTQGVTAFYASAFTVDSTASGSGGYTYIIEWLGGSAPTGGNASSIDSYSVTLIKTADKTFTILASLARFG
jgi:hypothetical protein